MKKLTCKVCGCYLGEIDKGRIRKDAVVLCEYCYSVTDLKSAADLFESDDNPLASIFKDFK